MSLRYDTKVAVVTGSGRGIGKQFALFFASRGAKVVVNDLGGDLTGQDKSQSVANQVVQQIISSGGIAVADYNTVIDGQKIIQTAIKNYGRIDVLINNAGNLLPHSFGKMTDEDWRQTFKVHAEGTYKCTRAAWNRMREQGYGRIINITSATGLFGEINVANYATAKMALHGFTQSLALEGAKRNVFTNSVAPIADTRLLGLVEKHRDLIHPKYIVPLVAYLCHESCKQNGSLFECGGGWFAKLRWQRGEGVRFDAEKMTTETVAQHFKKICSFDGNNEYPVYNPNWGNKVKEWMQKSKL